MYLARYAFDGDPTLLEAAYRRLAAQFPPETLALHLALLRADGIDVYDACPDVETFRAFSVSAQFRAAVAAAGLPAPRVDGLGPVVSAVLHHPVG
jgi:hypothetical protein